MQSSTEANTTGSRKRPDPKERDNDRDDPDDEIALATLAYIPVLCIVALVTRRQAEFVQFHTCQGAVLFALQLVAAMLFFVPWIGPVLALSLGLLSVGASVWAIGKVRARQIVSLPVVGRLATRLRL